MLLTEFSILYNHRNYVVCSELNLVLMYCRHKNVQVRNVAANLIRSLVANIGCDRIFAEFSDKILLIAAKFLSDSSPQVR